VPAGWAAAPGVPGASAIPAASSARPGTRDAGAGATIVLVVALLIVLVAVIALVLRRRRPAVAA
jgi:hypothetical protein